MHQFNLGKEFLKLPQLLKFKKKIEVRCAFSIHLYSITVVLSIISHNCRNRKFIQQNEYRKKYLRLTVGQLGLNGLTALSIKSELARKLNLDNIMNDCF